jgi:hypothetical protein
MLDKRAVVLSKDEVTTTPTRCRSPPRTPSSSRTSSGPSPARACTSATRAREPGQALAALRRHADHRLRQGRDQGLRRGRHGAGDRAAAARRRLQAETISAAFRSPTSRRPRRRPQVADDVLLRRRPAPQDDRLRCGKPASTSRPARPASWAFEASPATSSRITDVALPSATYVGGAADAGQRAVHHRRYAAIITKLAFDLGIERSPCRRTSPPPTATARCRSPAASSPARSTRSASRWRRRTSSPVAGRHGARARHGRDRRTAGNRYQITMPALTYTDAARANEKNIGTYDMKFQARRAPATTKSRSSSPESGRMAIKALNPFAPFWYTPRLKPARSPTRRASRSAAWTAPSRATWRPSCGRRARAHGDGRSPARASSSPGLRPARLGELRERRRPGRLQPAQLSADPASSCAWSSRLADPGRELRHGGRKKNLIIALEVARNAELFRCETCTWGRHCDESNRRRSRSG